MFIASEHIFLNSITFLITNNLCKRFSVLTKVQYMQHRESRSAKERVKKDHLRNSEIYLQNSTLEYLVSVMFLSKSNGEFIT